MVHGSDIGDNDADAMSKFIQVATEASYAGDPLRIVGMVAETVGQAVKSDPALYTVHFCVVIALLVLTLTRMYRLVA